MMTTIVAWLWQGGALAALTALVLHRANRLSAATRYVIWWLALAAVVLLPIVHTAALLSLALEGEPLQAAPPAAALIVMPAIAGWAVGCALGVWLATTIAGALRIAGGLRLVARLKAQSFPFDAAREKCLAMWSSVRHSGRRPELRVADVRCGASALGFSRPVILVSRDLVDALDDETLDQIVMHEHAHLSRFDDWSRVIQAVITTVAGLHPAVWFISRQIDLEREAACDDRVVSRTGAARRYAACLADAAEISVSPLNAALIPSAIQSSSSLRTRVVRLLGPRRQGAPRLAPAVCAAGLLSFAGIVIASKDVRPLVAFLESAPGAAAIGVLDVVAIPAMPFLRAAPAARPVPVESRTAKPAASVARDRSNVMPASTSEVQRAPAIESLPPTAPLDSDRLEHAYDTPATPGRAAFRGEPEIPHARRGPGAGAPWERAADAGIAVGEGAKRTGFAIGGFFTRAGKAIAGTF